MIHCEHANRFVGPAQQSGVVRYVDSARADSVA